MPKKDKKADLEEQVARLMDAENRAKQKSKKYRGIIVNLCHALDRTADYQKHVNCVECSHFYKDELDEARKI